MAAKNGRLNLETVHFGRAVELLEESDDVGVLLRGHLWIEALLEYAARNTLERPDAIDWLNARFEHKIALCEALGVADQQLASALRGFNKLRNRLAHEYDFVLSEDDVKTIVGRLGEAQRRGAEVVASGHLENIRLIAEAREQGFEIEIEAGMEWYPRVMTAARVRLYAFVVVSARELAVEGAFRSVDRFPGRLNSADFARHLDAEVRRMTGDLFDFQKLIDATGGQEKPPLDTSQRIE